MRRLLILFCLLALLLVGCAGKTLRTQEIGGVTYTLDTDAATVTGGGYTCQYTLSDDGTSVSIRFPDGKGLTRTRHGGGSISSTGTVDPDRMGLADDMAKVVWDLVADPPSPSYALMALFALIFFVSMGCLRRPYECWHMLYGFRLSYGEPNEMELTRFKGANAVCAILSALGFLFSLIPK
jgi:hypothetical protein